MVVADFVLIGGLILAASMLGFKWGVMERVADDFIEESMR